MEIPIIIELFFHLHLFSRTTAPVQKRALSYDEREKQFKKTFGMNADFGSFLQLRKLMQRDSRAGSGQNPTRNWARGPWLLSGPTRPGPHY